MQRTEVAAGQEAWHGITNPIAQQVVQEVFQHLPEGALERYSWKHYDGDSYQQQIRRRLDRSSLAQKIAAGTGELPLIFDSMPASARPLDWHSQIISPGELAVHVMRNLEWYLAPATAVRLLRPGEWLRRHGLSLFLLVLTFALLLTGMLTRNSGAVLLGQTLVSSNAAFIAALPAFLLAVIVFCLESLRTGDSYDIRCAEFFRYLVDTYADEEESSDSNPKSARHL
jgi:hypothetical protein